MKKSGSFHQHALTRRQVLQAGTMAAGGLVFSSMAGAAAGGLASQPKISQSAWASVRQNPAQTGVASCSFPEQPRLKWEFASPDGWVASCAIAGDHVYAPALSGYLHCLDLKTGREVWKYRSIESADEDEFAPGFKAAPLVTNQRIYVGDEDGILHAIDRATGKRLWKYETAAEIAGGVALYKGRILLASHDAYLYCLSEDGKEQWKFETNDRINCSPGIADHYTFVSGCDAELRVIDLETGKETQNVEMDSYLIASPAIVDDFLYVGSHGGSISCVNWRTGKVVWRYQGKRQLPFHASAAVTDTRVFVGGHDKHMHAIDRTSGHAAWTFPTKARISCSAAIVDERVFFGSGDGNLYGLATDDGRETWKFNCGKPVNAGIAIGEGVLLAGEDDTNGKLRCFGE